VHRVFGQSAGAEAVTSKLRRRSWASLALLAVAAGMTLTGVLSYASAYNASTAGMHTWFGFLFIALLGLHLTNNGRALVTYLRQPGGRRIAALSALLAGTVALGVVLAVPPFSSLLLVGRNLRRSVTLDSGSYQILTTRVGEVGQAIHLELRTGKHYRSSPQPLMLGLTYTTVPQVAFWVEDEQGRYLDTLYVTKKSTHAGFVPKESPFGTTARPEALPYWAHKRGVRYDNDLMVPSQGNTDLDAVTGATPRSHYDVRSTIVSLPQRFRVLMEINRSYDFNAYYTRDRFPDDPVYSGSGSSGQPSVIYAADVDMDDGQRTYLLRPIGHGHHSGRDGRLYEDLSGIDTGLELVDRVVVDVPASPG
jgi:hypothetical protein